MGKTQKSVQCPHCRANMKQWDHKVTPGLVGILIKAIKFVGKKENSNLFHPDKDLALTRIEYSNFQKLRFHGLIAKSGLKGYWLITRRGGKFLGGKMKIPYSVKTFRNKVVGHSENKIGIKEMLHLFPSFQQDFEYAVVTGIL